MHVGGAVQGAGTIHPRRRLNALLAIAAIVVIAAVVALMMRVTHTLYACAQVGPRTRRRG